MLYIYLDAIYIYIEGSDPFSFCSFLPKTLFAQPHDRAFLRQILQQALVIYAKRH